jgi:hypothetical protein
MQSWYQKIAVAKTHLETSLPLLLVLPVYFTSRLAVRDALRDVHSGTWRWRRYLGTCTSGTNDRPQRSAFRRWARRYDLTFGASWR